MTSARWHRLKTVWCWITTGHTVEESEWGYSHNTGIVDLFCADCQRLVRKVPLEDFPLMDEVLRLINEGVTDG